jgi:hypothetical protein
MLHALIKSFSNSPSIYPATVKEEIIGSWDNVVKLRKEISLPERYHKFRLYCKINDKKEWYL